MLKAFSKIRTKESTKYLKLFFISIPVLSLNYVEYVARGKEQINKKISSKAFIYDDGFVMGIAYFLTLLEQNEHYRTMHWDDSFKTYLAEAKKTSTLSPK